MKSKVTCKAQPALRLAAASVIYATRILDSSEEATISLYTKAELALVFTTLRDTSFKYTTQYSFNTLLLIFKAKYTNTIQILASIPKNQKFLISTSIQTSDNHVYKQLTTLFEPKMR